MSRGRTDGNYGLPARYDPADQDEDYDWIKYLGEGRSGSPGGQASGGRGSEPVVRPAGRLRRNRPVNTPEPRTGGNRAEPVGRQAPARDVGGWPASGRGDRRGDVVPPVTPVRRSAGDYSRPLYDGLGRDQAIPTTMPPPAQRVTRQPPPPAPGVDRRLDTSEYARPLYPPDETGPVSRPGRQRKRDTGERMTPPAARPYPPWPDEQRDEADPRSRQGFEEGWVTASGAGAAAPRAPQSSGSGRSAAVAKAAGSVATRRPKKPGSAKTRGGVKPGAAAKARVAEKPRVAEKQRPAAEPRPAAKPAAGASRGQVRARRPLTKGARRLPRRIMIVGGCLIVAVVAVPGYLLLARQPTHAVSTPSRLGAFAKEPRVDSSTARALRNKIVAGAAGEVKNVVAAVYEQTTGPGTSQGPQIVVFIGGNLSGGGSASDFIGGFMTQLHGSFTTNPGHLGGQAACAPGSNGGPAECAWADNDTFGVVVSATLSADGLASAMQSMRPQVEHTTK
jgi:hypothetical protein